MQVNFPSSAIYNAASYCVQQYPDPQIMAQLKALGLQPTGSVQGDLAAIQQAKGGSGQQITGAQQAQHTPRTPAAVASFMQKLGIQPTNSKEGDDAAIKAKLNSLEASVKSAADRQSVAGLKAEFTNIVAQAGGTGQAQLASMNKFFLVK